LSEVGGHSSFLGDIAMFNRHIFNFKLGSPFAIAGLMLATAGSMSAYGADTTATAKPEVKTGKGRPCEDLKASIASKLEAKGVKNYSLDVAAPDAVGAGKVVGSCEGGKMRIVYTRK
jgi:Protein of unknown function (DUF1161)